MTKILQNNYVLAENFLGSKYTFRYNEVSNEIEYKEKKDDEYKPLNENAIFRELMHSNYKISQANLASLFRSDFVEPYNPFQYYFERLPVWDEKTDWITLLANYIEAKDQQRFNHHFKKHLVRTVACALDDKYYNKQAFILVSETQNSGKSSFCRFLCPSQLADYFTESINPDNKDGEITLAENLLINLDELSVLSKADINKLKSYFSRQRIKLRRPFEKKATSAPRRASFVGSTNKMEFLSDETGSVRWLCFEIGKIHWEDYTKAININNVWSQAYSLYKVGFKHDPTALEIEENNELNLQFNVTMPEIEAIDKFYDPGTIDDCDIFYNSTDLMAALYEKYPSRPFNTTPEKIGKALKILGHKPASKRLEDKGYPIKGYYLKFKNDLSQPTTLTTDISNALPF